jgi:aminocarboxymuconate-semialdehyde decarboxylase
VPYLSERFDRGFEAFEDCRANIDRPPSEYLKKFFFDTVNFDPRCLQLAIDFAGPSQILAGSDYPHMIGSLDKMLASIGELELDDADRAAILGGNTERLLRLAP